MPATEGSMEELVNRFASGHDTAAALVANLVCLREKRTAAAPTATELSDGSTLSKQ
jgi:hypothetical protein